MACVGSMLSTLHVGTSYLACSALCCVQPVGVYKEPCACQVSVTDCVFELQSYYVPMALLFWRTERGSTLLEACQHLCTPMGTTADPTLSCGVDVQVPYGASFYTQVQWACQHAGKGKARLRVTGQVVFTKSCFVKGIITKSAQEVRLSLAPVH